MFEDILQKVRGTILLKLGLLEQHSPFCGPHSLHDARLSPTIGWPAGAGITIDSFLGRKKRR
jgi:hypothetical protein